MKLDVIIPVYNEEELIESTYITLSKTLENIKYTLLFINDGSDDKTKEILTNIYNKDKKHVKVINFSRNFGKDAAIYAGLKKSHAEYTAIIDADLEQDPKYLLKMLDELEHDKTIDEVSMINKYENANKIERIAKKSFYWIIKKLSGLSFKIGASDFRTFRAGVRKALLEMSEKNRFSKGLFSWVGFNVKYIEYNSTKRAKGRSKFKTFKQIDYATDGIINFSIKPLKIVSVIGILLSLISFIFLLVIFIKSLINGTFKYGYASLICITTLFGSIELLMLAIMAEYISKIHIETKNRPIYIEDNSLGFDEDIL